MRRQPTLRPGEECLGRGRGLGAERFQRSGAIVRPIPDPYLVFACDEVLGKDAPHLAEPCDSYAHEITPLRSGEEP